LVYLFPSSAAAPWELSWRRDGPAETRGLSERQIWRKLRGRM